MRKRGQGLPLNTVILAILVVLVLIVIVAFFLGGTSGVATNIKKIFFGATAGTDINLAVENCKQYCAQAKGWNENLWENSPYCSTGFELDTDNNGEADYCDPGEKDRYKKFYCWQSPLNIGCSSDIEAACDKQALVAKACPSGEAGPLPV